jgi:hypothetical protein
MRRFALALLAAMAALAQLKSPPQAGDGSAGQIGSESAEKAKRVVVMINAGLDGDTRPGAGMIFGLANDRVYIATANHLVRRGASNATDIQVEFRWLPGEHFKAQLLTNYDSSLDLAVIAVSGLAQTGVARAGLSLDRIGNPSLLAQGVRGDPVWAIGYPDGTEYDISAAQVNQVEAVVVTYRVTGLVPGGYSGGPVVDRSGLIVGMIRQDQPPNSQATRIDLILDQLKVWGYHIDLQSPSAAAGTNAFRDTLLRYITAAPLGFTSIGAANSIGGWVPSVNLPNASSCQGHGHGQEAVIACFFPAGKSESDAWQVLVDVIDVVRAALPQWKNSQMGDTSRLFWDGPTLPASTVLINVDEVLHGTDYEVVLLVHPSGGK